MVLTLLLYLPLCIPIYLYVTQTFVGNYHEMTTLKLPGCVIFKLIGDLQYILLAQINSKIRSLKQCHENYKDNRVSLSLFKFFSLWCYLHWLKQSSLRFDSVAPLFIYEITYSTSSYRRFIPNKQLGHPESDCQQGCIIVHRLTVSNFLTHPSKLWSTILL